MYSGVSGKRSHAIQGNKQYFYTGGQKCTNIA